jgi:hypothetical protein
MKEEPKEKSDSIGKSEQAEEEEEEVKPIEEKSTGVI